MGRYQKQVSQASIFAQTTQGVQQSIESIVGFSELFIERLEVFLGMLSSRSG